jgi:hypothetical protein
LRFGRIKRLTFTSKKQRWRLKDAKGGEKMKKTIGVISLALILLASAFAVVPVFGKNLNLPPGADAIIYYGAGSASIKLPTDPTLRVNYPLTATDMRIIAFHVEVPNAEEDFCSLLIELKMILTGTTEPAWQPYADIITDPNAVAYARNFWSGTLIEPHGPQATPDNVKLVSDTDLQVMRHGNNIYVNLGTSQQVQRTNGLKYVIPAFSMELKSYGGSMHTFETFSMTGYNLASNYILTEDKVGFNANGAFTSAAWGYNGVPVSDGIVFMHGISTYYPPVA